MRIIYIPDDSHEMSSLIFLENKFRLLSDAVVTGALRVNIKNYTCENVVNRIINRYVVCLIPKFCHSRMWIID